MYTYYSKHEIDEHMLYAEEIAEILKLTTESGNVHDKFVHAYLKDFIDKYIGNYQQLYFMNKYGGLKKVYSPNFLYAFKQLFEEHMKNSNEIYNIKINNKNYKIKRNGEIDYAKLL